MGVLLKKLTKNAKSSIITRTGKTCRSSFLPVSTICLSTGPNNWTREKSSPLSCAVISNQKAPPRSQPLIIYYKGLEKPSLACAFRLPIIHTSQQQIILPTAMSNVIDSSVKPLPVSCHQTIISHGSHQVPAPVELFLGPRFGD
jgi:hypothetical protein